MKTTNDQATVRSILARLAKRFHDGDDTREATELEAGTFRLNVGMAGNLRMTERYGKRFIVGRDLTAALGWPGFDDIDGTAIRLALITEAAELSLEPELRDTLEKCEELPASDFKAYLNANGIKWESSGDDESQWSIWMAKREVCDILNCDERSLEKLYDDRVDSRGRQSWRFKVASFDQAIQVEYENWLEKKKSASTRAD